MYAARLSNRCDRVGYVGGCFEDGEVTLDFGFRVNAFVPLHRLSGMARQRERERERERERARERVQERERERARERGFLFRGGLLSAEKKKKKKKRGRKRFECGGGGGGVTPLKPHRRRRGRKREKKTQCFVLTSDVLPPTTAQGGAPLRGG